MNTPENKSKGNFFYESSREGYRSVTTSLINRSFEWKDKQINILLEQAVLHLGELNAFSKYYPNIKKFLHLFAVREAVASAIMEGQQVDLKSVLAKSKSFCEVLNHTNAIEWGAKELRRFPLSIRLIKQAHQMLFDDIPMHQNYGGKLRNQQQIITEKYSRDNNYTPPNKHQLKVLINDGKKFWRNDKLELPHLIKMGISLYQFDNILPFLNGNGKTARTLILFELMELKFLRLPIFCFSVFCVQNRMEYYHRLNLVRTKNDIEQWILFFLEGVIKTTKQSNKILTSLYALNTYYLQQIEQNLGVKRQYSARRLIELFYEKPFLTVNDMKEALGISFQACNMLIKQFLMLNFVQTVASGRRNRVFFLWKYVALFEM